MIFVAKVNSQFDGHGSDLEIRIRVKTAEASKNW